MNATKTQIFIIIDIESDDSLTTDSECNNWSSGCVTKGIGCIDQRLLCSNYTGNIDTCNKMIGSDGKCTFNSTTSDSCKARTFSEAQLSTWDNASCGEYKSGCKSTGFSCVETYASCTKYDGDATSCLNFIGLEGNCAGDVSKSKCRARKCEDKQSSLLGDCQKYLSECILMESHVQVHLKIVINILELHQPVEIQQDWMENAKILTQKQNLVHQEFELMIVQVQKKLIMIVKLFNLDVIIILVQQSRKAVINQQNYF